MFRKFVSHLSFSPALITQIGFYANRLRGEELTRRLTVVFVVLALIVQSLAVFAPPESANASSEQDLIHGGVRDRDDLLARYDKNTDDIKDIYTKLGLTRADIERAHTSSVNSKDTSMYSTHRLSQYGSEQGETRFTYPSSTGGVGTRYISPLSLADASPAKQQSGTTYDAWVGNSNQLGWFAIIKANANLVTKGYPRTVAADTSITALPIVKSLTVTNLRADDDATTSTAKPFDTLAYTLHIENTGTTPIQVPLSLPIGDALQYAHLTDQGGGVFDKTHQTLSWGIVTLKPNTTEKRTFALRIMSPIPATPTGSSDPNSYDCILSTSYGSTAHVGLDCPPTKVAETLLASLPPVGPTLGFGLGIIILSITIYFHLRTRQLKKEIRIIRYNINTGTIA